MFKPMIAHETLNERAEVSACLEGLRREMRRLATLQGQGSLVIRMVYRLVLRGLEYVHAQLFEVLVYLDREGTTR